MPTRPTSRSIISCDQAEYYIRKRLLRTVSGTDQDADWIREAFLFCAREDSPRQLFCRIRGVHVGFCPFYVIRTEEFAPRRKVLIKILDLKKDCDILLFKKFENQNIQTSNNIVTIEKERG